MNLFSTKVTYNKVFWKELLIGALEGLAWFVVIGLLVYEFSDGIIELLQYMNDNFDTVLPICFSIFLPLFIIIGVVFKLLAFIIKYDVVDGKTVAAKRPATAKVATKKAATTKRTTTAKKKTTSKK